MEENTVLKLKSATQNLIILRSWGLSPATRVIKKKKKKVLHYDFRSFESFECSNLAFQGF